MVHVLWDASDLWGPLAVWGLSGLGAPFTLVRAVDIAEGVLQKENPSLLFVPGGFSRHKFAALGEAGQKAIRSFVHEGGAYIGFCGGAGLALSGEAALSLCPWKRAGYENRIQHYMSGHIYVKTNPNGEWRHPEKRTSKEALASREETQFCRKAKLDGVSRPKGEGQDGPSQQTELCLAPRVLFPIWWPGRFEPQDDDTVTVLAEYDTPGPDFWLADLPVSSLPPSVFADWEEKYGFSPSPSFLQGEPCVITGNYGKGRYILAYSHLETPESPAANAYLAKLLYELTGEPLSHTLVPAWNLCKTATSWNDPALAAMWGGVQSLFDAGKAAGMFFSRSPWLVGWRMGLPGAVCNTVRAQLFSIMANTPSDMALAFWREKKNFLQPAFTAFIERARSYLLAERLAMTLAKDLPETLVPEKLMAERTAVFGASGMAAHAGGLLGAILPELDELAYLQLRKK